MPNKDGRVALSVYMDTGAVIEFRAEKFTHESQPLTGKLVAFDYENAIGNVPRWIDLDRIVAITRAASDA